MLNLELPWRVAKGAVSSATYRRGSDMRRTRGSGSGLQRVGLGRGRPWGQGESGPNRRIHSWAT